MDRLLCFESTNLTLQPVLPRRCSVPPISTVIRNAGARESLQHRVATVLGQRQGSRSFAFRIPVFLKSQNVILNGMLTRCSLKRYGSVYHFMSIPCRFPYVPSFLDRPRLTIDRPQVGCISCMHFLCITMRASDTKFLPGTQMDKSTNRDQDMWQISP